MKGRPLFIHPCRYSNVRHDKGTLNGGGVIRLGFFDLIKILFFARIIRDNILFFYQV